MQEIMLEDQIKNIQQEHHGQNRKPRNRAAKKSSKQPSVEEASINMNISESLKSEIDMIPTKTPISILQELLSRRGITPTYELVQIEGAVHEPTFR